MGKGFAVTIPVKFSRWSGRSRRFPDISIASIPRCSSRI